MDKTLHSFLDWLYAQNDLVIWIFFAVSNFLENIFPPWPGDTVTVFGGFMLAHDTINFWELASSTLTGNIAGGILMFKFGKKFLHWIDIHHFPFKASFYSHDQMHKTFTWFHKNAVLVVVLSRFSAGIRFLVSIVAGMAHMRLSVFLFLFTLAIVMWCGLLIFGGYYLGNNWEEVMTMLQIYNKIILVILASAITYVIYRKYTGKK